MDWSDDFGKLYKERGQQRYGVRLFALWKIQEGMTETKVCALLNKAHETIRRWRKTYEERGLEALLSLRPGRGVKPHLPDKSWLEEALNTLQKERNGGRVRCQDIVNYVAEKYHISYSCSGMYHALHRLGFSWITGRSQHPKHDPEAIEAFKKTL